MKAKSSLIETLKRRKGELFLGAYLVLTGISNTFGPDEASVFWDVVFYTLETAIVIFGMFAYIRERSALGVLLGLGVIAYKVILIGSIYYGAIRSGGVHEVFTSFILSNTAAMISTPAITIILFIILKLNGK